jgi:hypothetical protein
MLAVLASHACAGVWQKRHAHLSLDQVLVKLFVRATSTSPQMHTVHTMCGVFSSRQANAACKMLGVADVMAARHLMQQLRLCCVDSVRAFYAALKQALP